MAVICRLANARKWRWVLYIILSLVFALYCFHDGWKNPKFQAADKQGDLLFNRVGAIVLAVAFVYFVIRFFFILKTKVVLDEKGIAVNGRLLIPWQMLTGADDTKVEKGLLALKYKIDGQEKQYVLDNYLISHFEDAVEEISRNRSDLLPPVDESEIGEK